MDAYLPKYSANDINWDHIRRNFAFQKGVLKPEIEYIEESSSSNNRNRQLRQFRDLPCLLPIQMRTSREDSIPVERRLQSQITGDPQKNVGIMIEEEKNDEFEKVNLDDGPNFQNVLEKAK